MNKIFLAAAFVLMTGVAQAATPPVFLDATEPAAGENLMADMMPQQEQAQAQKEQVPISEPQYYSASPKQQAQLAPADAASQDQGSQDNGVKIVAPKMHQVTSLQKCLDQLSPEDAAEVKLNAIRPYQECIGRLAEKAQTRRSKKLKDKEELAAEPEAENARNYSRIQEDGDKSTTGHWTSKAYRKPAAESEPPESADEMVEEDRPVKRRKSAEKKGFFGWSPTIKADNSKRSFNN